MKKSLIAGLSLASLTLVPAFAFAAAGVGAGVATQGAAMGGAAAITDFGSLINAIRGWLNLIIGLLFAVAVFYVVWGIFEFVQSAGDEEKRKEGRDRMITGLIGVVLMSSIYGLIGIVSSSVATTATTATIPTV